MTEDHWGKAADAWRKAAEKPERGASGQMAEWMLEAAALQPGERVLELAAGAGRVGLQAAAAVGPDGHVLLTDLSDGMVDAIIARAGEQGLTNVTARVADAQELDLDGDAPFDVVLCRNGLMLMPDPAAALARAHAALGPGGRVVIAHWGRPEHNPWLMSLLGPVMEHFGAPPPEPGTPGPFALGDPGRLTELLATAGFSGADAQYLAATEPHDSAQAWFDHLLEISAPVAAMLQAAGEDGTAAIRERAFAAAAQHADPASGEITFPAEAVVGHARR